MVEGADLVIEFCVALFGAHGGPRFARPDGSIMHAEIRLDDSVIMVADATAEWGASPGILHVYVPDVESTYRRALELGATSSRRSMMIQIGARA